MKSLSDAIRAIYTKYTKGDRITDAELDQLLSGIEAAMPFLEASPAFSLVCREARTDREALRGYREARGRRESSGEVALPPVQFIGLLKRHIGIEPIRYRLHLGTETPHLFTFPLQGRGYAGQATSFSINFADMQILMEQHGLRRMQSNDPGEITLYFCETAK